jgi:hypothetical protein
MPIGPVEYMIVGFPGNQFSGEIFPELAKLMESEMIRVLDLLFIMKDADGNVVAVELDEAGHLDAFSSVEGEIGGLLSPEDVEYAGAGLEPNSSAALLIWEDTWAIPFQQACLRANGVLLESARIPHAIMEEALGASAT